LQIHMGDYFTSQIFCSGQVHGKYIIRMFFELYCRSFHVGTILNIHKVVTYIPHLFLQHFFHKRWNEYTTMTWSSDPCLYKQDAPLLGKVGK
jgi:hypothetical protein